MSGLGEHLPEFVFSGAQVAPRDIDAYTQHQFINVGTSDTWFGTVTSATANAAFVFDNILPDYPRNILFSIKGVAGGMGGSAVINGISRFGNSIQETFAIGSAAAGGSVSGTHIFSRITSGSLTSIDGLGGTAIGTAAIGYAVGTSTTAKFWLGLPTRLGGTSDIKSITWIKNFVPTTLNGGTLTSTHINGTLYAISGSAILGSAETFNVSFKSTYDNLGKVNMAGL